MRRRQHTHLEWHRVLARILGRCAGDVADLCQFCRHHLLWRLGHDAYGHVHFLAQEIVNTVVEQQIERDVGIEAFELNQPTGLLAPTSN